MRNPFSLSNTLTSLLLSLALAILIWIVAANNALEQRTDYPSVPESGIPIELRNIPPGMIVTEGESQRVVVDLLINSERSQDLAPDDLIAYVDLSGLGPGRHQVEVIVERQPFAPPFRILAERPNRISVRLDEEIEKELAIEVVTPDIATVASNFQVLTPTVSPSTLTITGPRVEVEPVERVVAEVQLDGARSTVERIVEPQLFDGDGNRVPIGDMHLSARDVTVTVPVEQRPGYRELIVRTEITGTSSLAERGYWIRGTDTKPPLVAVVGQQEVVEELDGIVETEPLDVADLSEGVTIRQVPLELPEGISPVDQDFVTVTIRVEPQTSSKTITLRPRVSGLSPGLVVTDTGIVPPTIDVLLRGPIRELEALNLDDVSATLDLSGRGPGAYLIRPRINAPTNLRAESVIPEQVEVTIGEARATRTLSLLLRPTGLPAVSVAAISPRQVTATVEGPALAVAGLDERVLPASVTAVGLEVGTHVLQPMVELPPEVNLLGVSPATVTVRVFPQTEVLTLAAPLAVQGLQETMEATLNPDTVALRVVGPGTALTLSTSPEFGLDLFLTGLPEGEYVLRPAVRLPANYYLVGLLPETIEVRLESTQ